MPNTSARDATPPCSWAYVNKRHKLLRCDVLRSSTLIRCWPSHRQDDPALLKACLLLAPLAATHSINLLLDPDAAVVIARVYEHGLAIRTGGDILVADESSLNELLCQTLAQKICNLVRCSAALLR